MTALPPGFLQVVLDAAIARQPFHLIPCPGDDPDQAGTQHGVDVQGYILSVHGEGEDHSAPGGHGRVALHLWCDQAIRWGWRFWAVEFRDGLPTIDLLEGEAVLSVLHRPILPLLIAVPTRETRGWLHLVADFGSHSTPNREDVA